MSTFVENVNTTASVGATALYDIATAVRNGHISAVVANILDVNTVATDLALGASSKVKIVGADLALGNSSVLHQSIAALAKLNNFYLTEITTVADYITANSTLIGKQWTNGAGAPSGGSNEDYYLNTTNGDVYKKTIGTWNVIGNIKGPTGADSVVPGPPGTSVSSITGPTTVGLVDTYTIHFSDSSTATFDVTNGADSTVAGPQGVSISSVSFLNIAGGGTSNTAGVAGATDTYKILFSNTTSTTFTIKNGANGAASTVPGPPGNTGTSISSIALLTIANGGTSNVAGVAGATDTYRITLSDTTHVDYVVKNGVNGAGVGYMIKATYDPTNINASAFNVDNHASGTTNKVFTATEKTKLAGIATGATAIVNIDDLADVVVLTPARGEVLKFNGTNWVNGSDAGVTLHANLTDTTTSGHPATAITEDTTHRFITDTERTSWNAASGGVTLAAPTLTKSATTVTRLGAINYTISGIVTAGTGTKQAQLDLGVTADYTVGSPSNGVTLSTNTSGVLTFSVPDEVTSFTVAITYSITGSATSDTYNVKAKQSTLTADSTWTATQSYTVTSPTVATPTFNNSASYNELVTGISITVSSATSAVTFGSATETNCGAYFNISLAGSTVTLDILAVTANQTGCAFTVTATKTGYYSATGTCTFNIADVPFTADITQGTGVTGRQPSGVVTWSKASNTDLFNGLQQISYLKMDGNLTDVIGTYTWTNSGLSWTTGSGGKIGEAIKSTGNAQYASISPAIDIREKTISMWIKANSSADCFLIFASNGTDYPFIARATSNTLTNIGGTMVFGASNTCAISTTQYDHLVLQFSATAASNKVYKNGVLIATGSNACPAYNLFLGCQHSALSLNAYIDQFRVYNGLLNVEQIAEIYNRENSGNYLYNDTNPFYSSTHSQLLLTDTQAQGNGETDWAKYQTTLVEEPVNVFVSQADSTHLTISEPIANGDKLYLYDGATLYTDRTVSGVTAASYDSYTKLLLHGEDITDSSTNAVTLTNTGTVTADATSFKFGSKSLKFSGSNYLAAPTAAVNIDVSDFTIDFWIKENGAQTNYGMVGQWNIGENTGNWRLYKYANIIYFDSSAAGINSVVGVTLTGWTHIAVVRSSGTVKLYINGIATGTTSSSFGAIASSLQLLIGGAYLVSSSYYFNGYLDELRISVGVARWTAYFTPPTYAYTVTALTISGAGISGITKAYIPSRSYTAIKTSNSILVDGDFVEDITPTITYNAVATPPTVTSVYAAVTPTAAAYKYIQSKVTGYIDTAVKSITNAMWKI